MPNTLDLETFRRLLNGKTIDVARAVTEYRLVGIDVPRADLNRDGRIATRAEIDALFRQIDKADHNGDVNSVSYKGRDGQWNEMANVIQAIGDVAGVDIFRELARDDVVIVGMNAGSKYEAAALKRGGRNVIYIKNSDAEDKIEVGGTRYDLRKDADLKRFVALLGLPAKQSGEIAAAIHDAEADAADELASIAWNWVPAEKGRDIPGRLVFSGHSYGEGVFGDANGFLRLDAIAALAKAMPKAAAKIEDLHISGCYSAGEANLARWRQVFPNVLTIWAYTGSAPGSGSGATTHMVLWDHATRGAKDAIDRLIAAKTTGGESVAVWSRAHGYQDGKPLRALSLLRTVLLRQGPVIDAYFAGDRVVAHTQVGDVRHYYNIVQELLRHPALPADERPALEKKRDVTLRLNFYLEKIRGRFATVHGGPIAAGYRALGLAPPDFAKLSRKEALAAIARFTDAARTRSPVPAEAQAIRPALEQGLRDLLPGPIPAIPATWI